jgi:predicted nucleic acid-binding protein
MVKPIRYLIDTSVWVNLFRGDQVLRRRIDDATANGIQIITCEVIVMELLAGARPNEDARIFDLLNRLPSLPFNPNTDFRAAGFMFRDLAQNGVTIRNSVDCIIAVAAMSSDDIVLIHNDLDFVNMSRVNGIRHERWEQAA